MPGAGGIPLPPAGNIPFSGKSGDALMVYLDTLIEVGLSF